MLQLIYGEKVKDGAGVSLNRVIGTDTLDNADPFLLLDEFKSTSKEDYIAGFPMHPHRGFETITYMIEGSFTHRDSKGNEGRLKAGEVQWMTAGRGIVHEEMPAMDKGQLWGYQLWINLPSRLKMIEPNYRHLTNSDMPVVHEAGLQVKIISGSYNSAEGPIELHFPVDYFDVRLNGGIFEKALKGTNLIYVHTGSVTIEAEDTLQVTEGNLCIISNSCKVKVTGNNAGFLYLSSEPLREKIARYGPFVMNDMDEVLQAMDDFNADLLDE